MAADGFVRATEDIDIIIREDDLEQARAAVAECGFTIPLKPRTDNAGTIHRVSKVRETELLPLDIMLVTPVYADVWNHRVLMSFEGFGIPVIARQGMIIRKKRAGRRKDLLDLQYLKGDEAEAT
jgi:hypothetical protein